MIRPPQRPTRTAPLFTDTSLFRSFVPRNGMVDGDRMPDVNPKKPKEVGQYYAARPAQLPPGEYAITVGGMFIVGRCGGPVSAFRVVAGDRKSTRLNSSHYCAPSMPSSA